QRGAPAVGRTATETVCASGGGTGEAAGCLRRRRARLADRALEARGGGREASPDGRVPDEGAGRSPRGVGRKRSGRPIPSESAEEGDEAARQGLGAGGSSGCPPLLPPERAARPHYLGPQPQRRGREDDRDRPSGGGP